MNDFYLQTAEKWFFFKEINSYISISFFVYFDTQTKSSVSKSKQTANYVKKDQDLYCEVVIKAATSVFKKHLASFRK
jgi:hypothetical protein